MNNTTLKTAVLIQAHKESEYLKILALTNPEVNFYLHFDSKSTIILDDYKKLSNVTILENRVNVKWGGFSQVEATLLLLKEALKEPTNFFFHLISGEDCILQSFDSIEKQISKNDPEIYIDFRSSLKHRHRTRFFAIHANTNWQRSFWGKILTKINLFLDKLLPIFESREKLYLVYGSSWFSINRIALELISKFINEKDKSFFYKKLCPDEHFFQYVLAKYELDKFRKNGNMRFIDLPDNRNHPRYLEINELIELSSRNYWMARKVNEKVQLAFLREKKWQ